MGKVDYEKVPTDETAQELVHVATDNGLKTKLDINNNNNNIDDDLLGTSQKTAPTKVVAEEVEYEFDHGASDSDEEYEDDENYCLCIANCRAQLPKIRSRWKSLAAAVTMFILGWVFLIIGSLLATESDWTRASSCLILGTLLELPGAYVCFVFYKALQQDPEFDLDMIPSYE